MASALFYSLCVMAVIAACHVSMALAAKRRCEFSKTHCNDGTCVSPEYICDGKNDCADASDELNCGEWKCPLDKMWPCANSSNCLWLEHRCDGSQQCSDGSDENNCAQWKCPEEGWSCPNSNRNHCIRSEKRCDGQDDCGDNSDEQNCGNWTCAPGLWKCGNNKCIHMIKRCDKNNDCGDVSDEQGCRGRKCPAGYWRCVNKGCIPLESRCDGYNQGYIDCTDGSDEVNCGCGDAQTGASGVIQSPNFPAPYSSSINCSWTIDCTRCKGVALSFTALDVESDPTCGYDYIEVLDGTGPNTTSMGKFCGSRAPERIATTSNQVTVRFVSDGSVVKQGFRLEYQDTDLEKCSADDWQCKNKRCIPLRERCDGSLDCTDGSDEENCGCGARQTGRNGAIQSPNHPRSYENYVNCSWVIGSNSGKPIQISFTAFSLETESSCRYDHVELWDGDCPGAPSLGKLCGYAIPRNITPTSDKIRVNFKTDGSVVYSGFRLEFHK